MSFEGGVEETKSMVRQMLEMSDLDCSLIELIQSNLMAFVFLQYYEYI